MMDKRHNESQDDSYYDQLIKERIGQALRNHSQEERLDIAQLEAWVEADRLRKRAKVKRYLAIASCFLILCIGMFSIKYAFDGDDTVVIAGKNDDKVNESGNNAVVKPNEEDVDENAGIREMECNSWEDVEMLKQKFTSLMEPHYIPEGYKFNTLSVKYSDIMEHYTYIFTNGKDELEITQVSGATTTVFSEYVRKIKCDYGDLLIMEDKDVAAGCKLKDGMLYVLTNDCSDDELVKIVNNIN